MTSRRPLRRDWADSWIAPAILVLAVAAVFLRSVGGDFVEDDRLAIVANRGIRDPESWSAFFTKPDAVDPYHFVRPLRYLEYAVDWKVFGDNPAGFHVHSLLWHAAGAVFFLLVLRRLLGDGRAALGGALLWAVHPVQVEPVAWIAGRSDVAMGACSFAAALFCLRTRGLDRDFAAALVATALAAMYKETALAIPLVVAALRWTGFSVARVWPFAAVAGACVVYRIAVRHAADDRPDFFPLGVGVVGVFATMVRGFGFYVVEVLLPAPSFDWHLTPSRSFADGAVVAWLAVHAMLVVSAVRARRRAPCWTLAVAWFYLFLLPVSNWPVFLGIFTAERYLYLPLAGAALAFAWTLARTKSATWPAAIVVLASLSTSSVARCGIWRSDAALYGATLSDHDSPLALEFAGRALRADAIDRIGRNPDGAVRDAGDPVTQRTLERSLDAFHRMLHALCASTPSDRPVGACALRGETNASNVCWFLGRDDEALFHAEEALRIDGTSAQAEYDRALALLRLGFPAQAIAAMRRARALGFSEPDDEIGGFLLDAADRCRRDGLVGAARDGFEAAAEACPDGARRTAARVAIATLRSDFPAAPAVEDERVRMAELDAALARRPRRCPFEP